MALSRKPQDIVADSNNPLLAKHESWERISVEEIAYILNGFAFKSSNFTNSKGMPLVRIRDVGKDSSETYYEGEFDDAYIVNDGDLLVGMDGDFRCAIWRGGKALLNQRVCKISLKTDSYDFKFLTYVLQPYLNAIHTETSAVTVKHLSSRTIGDIPLPLPPKEQQKRIVAKIEELFSHIDAGIEALKKAKQLLKQYRQSVLKAAVTGELTKEWREANKAKLEPASQLLERILKERREKWEEQQLEQFKAKGNIPKNEKWKEKYKEAIEFDADVEIPEAWVGATTDQVFYYVTSGSRGWAKYYSDEGPVFLRMGNLEHYDVRLDLEDIQRVSPPEGAEGSRTKVEQGDSLISITADVGMVGIVPDGFEEAYINQHVALARPVIREMGLYLAWLLSGDFAKEQFKALQRGATKVGLGLDDIKAIQFGLPSVDEQRQIVNQIEEKLSSIERLTKIIEKQSLLAEKQKQTILSSAFAGELIENDYSGESAADLLGRINKEKTLLETKEKLSKRKSIKKKVTKMARRPIIDVLKDAGAAIGVDEIFEKAGYASDLTAENIEKFYSELKEVAEMKEVEVSEETKSGKKQADIFLYKA